MFSFSIIIFLLLFFSLPQTIFSTTTTTIEITKDSFKPQEVSVEQNSLVQFKNADTAYHWPASNFHPTHKLYPEFDPLKGLRPGETWQFIPKKAGIWKYHDHLFPHIRGTLIVKETKQNILEKIINLIQKYTLGFSAFLPKEISPTPEFSLIDKNFTSLSEKEQFLVLENKIEKEGLEKTWQFIIDTYKNTPLNAHDLAHFTGQQIYEKKGLSSLSICDPSFAFGCYHGFTEAAFHKNLDDLGKIETTCQKVGQINSGPWASCIHGIGHGIGTYFDTTDLKGALSACDRLKNGANYCHDGVFMEFAISAPKSFYRLDNPLYPCDSLVEKYKQGCARQQPTVMKKYFSLAFEEIASICLNSKGETIKYFCIDSLGLDVGQRSLGNPQFIISECNKLNDPNSISQCISAAAGEIVFQKFPGWENNAFTACNSLPPRSKQDCIKRVNETIASYSN